MELLESLITTRIGSFAVMVSVVLLFVSILRFLYGPKGIFRKNLWDGINNEKEIQKEKLKTKKEDI